MLKNILNFLFLLFFFYLGMTFHYKLIGKEYYLNEEKLQKSGEKREEEIFFKLKKMSNKKCVTEKVTLLIEMKEEKIYYEKIKNNYFICE
jgi:hypothetical protein